jgi:hypothetical protein
MMKRTVAAKEKSIRENKAIRLLKKQQMRQYRI